MGKKSRDKKDKRKAKAAAAQAAERVGVAEDEEVSGSGDLRLIEAHVQHWIAGTEEAEAALKMLGKDASLTVMQIGERLKNEKVIEFGKRLVAVKPQFPTNLHALREDSVVQHITTAQAEAPLVADGVALPTQGHVFAIFDPAEVAYALVKGGRPRADAAKVAAGEIAQLPLAPLTSAEVELNLEPPPAGQAVAVRALNVASGVIFVGPPEAADGPRMGTIRLDPFRTALDDHLDRGGFRRLPAGRYKVCAYRTGDSAVRVHLEATDETFDTDEGAVPGS